MQGTTKRSRGKPADYLVQTNPEKSCQNIKTDSGKSHIKKRIYTKSKVNSLNFDWFFMFSF